MQAEKPSGVDGLFFLTVALWGEGKVVLSLLISGCILAFDPEFNGKIKNLFNPVQQQAQS